MISDASRGNSVFFLRADACRAHVGFMSLGLTLAFLLRAAPVDAQLKAKVSIDPSQQKAVLYTSSIGVAANRWDTRAFDPATMQLLGEAVTNVRFPGNGGIEALYHWSTGTIINPYTNDRAPAFARERHFPAAVPVIDALGSAVISVNYGSNLDGCGGGEPLEAAAWVACANGNPGNAQPIGKDSKGNDWKTVGFWATLRASAPLPTDDGYNQLRIPHAAPLGILRWTIGNEPCNNGFYGQSRTVGSDADNSENTGKALRPNLTCTLGK